MSTHSPDPGWYDDPHVALKLRWWDGHRWTHHTRAKPVTPHAELEERFAAGGARRASGSAAGNAGASDPTLVPPYTGAPIRTATIDDVAEPAAAAPYPYTAPSSLTPASPPPGSVAAVHSPMSSASPASAGGPSSAAIGEAEPSRRASRSASEYVPDRAAGPSLWAIAATPLLLVLGGLTGVDALTTLLLVAGLVILPTLWLVAFAVRDRAALRAWGHARRPSLWWLLLGPLGYLTARAVTLRHRRATTVIALALCVAAIALVLALAPTLIVLAIVA